LLSKNTEIVIPSLIPPVVANAILTSGNTLKFNDNVNWVGDSYVLHKFQDYKIVDSAQKVKRDQFKDECNPVDLMIFSFYPTKPIGGCDGGMVVSDDWDKIRKIKELAFNGLTFSNNSWDREIKCPGYKMYMNSIQAHIANKNLMDLDKKNDRLSRVRDIYNRELGYNNSSDHLYRIDVEYNQEFVEKMKGYGIMCGIHYGALHLNKLYNPNPVENENVNSVNVSTRTVSIPFHEKLTKKQISFISETINEHT